MYRTANRMWSARRVATRHPAHLDEHKLEYTKVHFKRIALQMTMELKYIGVKRTTSQINFERPRLKCPAPGANQAPCVSSGQQV